ncbi:MAG: YceI family protein [Myxococcales bacterium]|nr:MAG: YceI family protein [Myxococcales bacterium]
MKTAILSVLLVSAALAGCNNDPVKDKPKAVTPTTAAANAAKPAVAATTYKFDGTDSKVGFVGAKITGKHEGTFKTFTGTIQVPGTDIEHGSVKADIEAGSVASDQAKLDEHLKSPDFFNVAQFPKATFESTKIVKGGTDGATHTITGNLTLHGVTKSITFPAKVAVAGDTVTVDADFGINRKDFGIAYAGKADDLIKDEVLMKLAIKAKKA